MKRLCLAKILACLSLTIVNFTHLISEVVMLELANPEVV